MKFLYIRLVDENEPALLMLGESEDDDVLLCSLENENKSGSWNCVWQTEVILYLEDITG